MLKQKITGSVQEVILPDFLDDDDNTVTTTVTKSRRVSFGPNFVKEFIVDSAISAQCMPEYEQPSPSSDSSNADSTHSAISHGTFVLQENLKVHKSESEATENRPKPPKFASTICFSADSPTADMEFTEGCITLAKSILDKKNKEMTVFIQAKPKGPKEEEKAKEETNYFEGSQFEMSMTQCFKSKENRREENRFAGEKTKIFGKCDDEMSMTRCERFFNDEDEDESKENRMPLDAIMRYLDKDESDSDLFNPERSFAQLLGVSNSVDLSDESEKLNLNESMEISGDLNIAVGSEPSEMPPGGLSEKLGSKESMRRFGPLQWSEDKMVGAAEHECSEETEIVDSPKGGCLDVAEKPIRFAEEVSSEEMVVEEMLYEKITAEDMISEKMVSGKVMYEEMVVEQIISEKMASEKLIPEETAAKKTRSEKMVTEEIIAEKMVTQERASEKIIEEIVAEKMVTQEKASEKIITEEIVAEKMASEKMVTEEMVIEKTITEEIVAEKMASEKIIPEEIVAEKMASEKIIEEIVAEKMVTQEKASEKITPEEVVAEKMASEKMVTEEMVIEKTITEEIVAEKMASEKIIPEEIVAEKMASEKIIEEIIAEKMASEKIIPEEIVADKMPSEKIIAEKMVTQEKASEKMPSEKITPEEIVADKMPSEKIIAEKMVTQEKASEKMPSEKIMAEETSPEETVTEDLMDVESLCIPPPFTPKPTTTASQALTPLQEDDDPTEPSLGDLKVIESLKEQAKEEGCAWSLRGVQHPRKRSQGLLSFSCRLLDSTTSLHFSLRMSAEDTLHSCSVVTDSSILLDQEGECRLPEYTLAVGFGFEELKKYFRALQGVTTLRHVPYYMDWVNSFLSKMNAYLRQIYAVLTSYPGSKLDGGRLSFRLFSFPLFLSCVVSIDLSNAFRLSKASLSFEHDFGCLDEKKVGEIFEESLKGENSLCEFVVRSTRYLVELERQSGYLSKRKHIRLLPDELKS